MGRVWLINSSDRQDSCRTLFLPYTKHVVMKNGDSEKLWEIPEDCFGLGWIPVANSIATECKITELNPDWSSHLCNTACLHTRDHTSSRTVLTVWLVHQCVVSSLEIINLCNCWHECSVHTGVIQVLIILWCPLKSSLYVLEKMVKFFHSSLGKNF